MASEIPDEVYEVAARARRLASYGHDAAGLAPGDRASVDAVWPIAYAAGRASQEPALAQLRLDVIVGLEAASWLVDTLAPDRTAELFWTAYTQARKGL